MRSGAQNNPTQFYFAAVIQRIERRSLLGDGRRESGMSYVEKGEHLIKELLQSVKLLGELRGTEFREVSFHSVFIQRPL